MVNIWTKSIVVGLAVLGLWAVNDVRADTTPEEGDLIVNVNTATQQELETVPGLGEVLAKRVIAGRPYKRVDDLVRVQGIGEQSLEKMRPYLKVEGKTEER